MNFKVAASVLLIGLGVSVATHAQAAQRRPAPSRVVKFTDLDISTEAGARALELRIRRAAEDVCLEAVGARQDMFFGACYASVTNDAVAKVNRPLLTAVHKAQTLSLVAARR